MMAMGEDNETRKSLMEPMLSSGEVKVAAKWYQQRLTNEPDLDQAETGSNFFQVGSQFTGIAYIEPTEFMLVKEMLDPEEGDAQYPHGLAIYKGKESPGITLSQFALYGSGSDKIEWHGVMQVGGDSGVNVAPSMSASKRKFCDTTDKPEFPECQLWNKWTEKKATEAAALFGENAKMSLYTRDGADNGVFMEYTGAEDFATALVALTQPASRRGISMWHYTPVGQDGVRMLFLEGGSEYGVATYPLPLFHSFVMTKDNKIIMMHALFLRPEQGELSQTVV